MSTSTPVLPRTLWVFAGILGLSFVVGAFILGKQLRNALHNQQTISVKGLAEKPVTADSSEWTVGASATGATEDEVLDQLSVAIKSMQGFLKEAGFPEAGWLVGVASLEPNMEDETLENGTTRQVQNGWKGAQSIRLKTKDIQKVVAAFNQCTAFNRTQGHKTFCRAPEYLVSNLEGIKMSLIADATKNARSRAQEFVKNDSARVGPMTSARQGAFYIVPEGGSPDDSDYGGTYDKSTIDKLARVVVTIDYAILQ